MELLEDILIFILLNPVFLGALATYFLIIRPSQEES